MLVLLLTACPPRLKGDISKWLFEIHPGVYIGSPSRRVADQIWNRVTTSIRKGKAVMALSASNEQGYVIRTHHSDLEVTDFDGIQLMKHIKAQKWIEQEESIDVKKLSTPDYLHFKDTFWPSGFIILCIETSGPNPNEDTILEIGALKVKKGKEVDCFHTYIRSVESIPESQFMQNGNILEKLSQGLSEPEAVYYLNLFRDKMPILVLDPQRDLLFLKKAAELNEINLSEDQVFDIRELAKWQGNVRPYDGLNGIGRPRDMETLSQSLENCRIILLMLEKMIKTGLNDK
ncbi:MAG: type I-E CRISPR-associated endoribonuclease Cas2e [Allobaculum sp.]|uniref:type I-E CRISPR-associated endoribonuclease Cas2e n=1 Tax=Allobaculum sp. TaxID=1872463 RepID=UPI003999FD65